MSLLGFDSVGSATINGLTEVNANNVFSDVLYYDANTVPVNVKTAIAGVDADVTVLEGQMVTANSNISTLQGQMVTANSNISTLQSDMTAAEDDIDDLESDMNTAQGDINDLQADVIALGVTVGTTATTVAGLVASQLVQDGVLTAHTGSINTLNGEMNDVESDVAALQQVTTALSFSAITGSTFSGRLNIGSTLAGVELNTSTISTFGSGIETDTINSDNTMTLTADGFAINATVAGIQTFATTSSLFQSTSTTTLTSGGETEINCAALDINASGAATLDATGFNINATTAGIQTFSTLSSLFQSTTTTTLTSGGETEINCTDLDVNASAAITINSGLTTTITSNQIMTLEVALGSISGILIKTNDSANDIELTTIGANSDIKLLSTAATVTITAATEADITCATLDLNASGAATLDADSITLTTTNALGAGNIRLNPASGSDVTINAAERFVITTETLASSAISHTSVNTSSDDMRLRNNARGTGYLMRLAQTNTSSQGLTLNGVDNGINTIKSNGAASTLKLESDKDAEINVDDTLDINASILTIDAVNTATINSDFININSTSDITIDSGDELFLNSATETQINCGVLDINSSGDITIDSTTVTNITALTDINLTASDISIITTGAALGTITISASSNLALTGNPYLDINSTGTGLTRIGNATGGLALTGATSCSGLSTLTGGFTSSASSNMNHNFLIQQNSYTQPMATNSQLGYTNTLAVATSTLATGIGQEGTWTLPSKGVWLICATVTFSTNSSADTEFYQAVISLTTASTTEASAGLSYYEEDDQVVSAANVRDKISMTGVVSVTAATSLFFNAAGATSGTAPSVAAAISWTRIA